SAARTGSTAIRAAQDRETFSGTSARGGGGGTERCDRAWALSPRRRGCAIWHRDAALLAARAARICCKRPACAGGGQASGPAQMGGIAKNPANLGRWSNRHGGAHDAGVHG